MHATIENTVRTGAERVLRDLAANIRVQDALEAAAAGGDATAARKERKLAAARHAIEARLLAKAPSSPSTAVAVAIVNAAQMDRYLTSDDCEATAEPKGVAPALWALIRSAVEPVIRAGSPELEQIVDWYLPAV